MFAAAICVSILLGVLVWALPGRLYDRRATHADVLAGPGIVLAVWIIAACVFAQPGLAQGFDLFRLLHCGPAALCCYSACAEGGGTAHFGRLLRC
mgnify:CR=1 FL=1